MVADNENTVFAADATTMPRATTFISIVVSVARTIV